MSLRVLATTLLSTHLLTEGGKTTPAESVGTLAIDSNGKMYRYVKNVDTTCTTYDLCTFQDRANNLVTQQISTGNEEQPAGVYDASTDIAANEYFWLQVAGEAQVNTETVTTLVVGDPLAAHASAPGEADEVDVASVATLKVGMGEVFAVVQALEVAGTPDTVKCRLFGLV